MRMLPQTYGALHKFDNLLYFQSSFVFQFIVLLRVITGAGILTRYQLAGSIFVLLESPASCSLFGPVYRLPPTFGCQW
jgi:hypothetical protein